jgi:hypothetical protein
MRECFTISANIEFIYPTSGEDSVMAKTKRRGRKKETVSGFFRQIFNERPELLDSKSNEELIGMWRDKHPNQKEVPSSVRQNLSNLKSNLRKQRREAQGLVGGKRSYVRKVQVATGAGGGQNPLESLEEAIDECLTTAKNLDRRGLDMAIKHLRRARNEVVWKLGQ